MDLIFESTTYFRFLDYHVSHNQLLIRGEKAIESNNIDLVFEGTDFLHCPSTFDGIKLYYLNERSSQEKGIEMLPFSRNFLLESKGNEYFIQAGILRIYRNSLGIFESSIDTTGKGQENLLWISR